MLFPSWDSQWYETAPLAMGMGRLESTLANAGKNVVVHTRLINWPFCNSQ